MDRLSLLDLSTLVPNEMSYGDFEPKPAPEKSAGHRGGPSQPTEWIEPDPDSLLLSTPPDKSNHCAWFLFIK